MLENTDTLLTLAEIAAAFAGFAALVSVIRPRGTRGVEWIHDLLRLRLVIASSVAGIAAALIPIGLAGYGLDSGATWRLASVIFVIFGYGILLSLTGTYRPVKGTFPPDRIAIGLVSFLEVIEQASLLTIIFGIPLGNPPALYVTALICNICQAGFIFVRFVGSTFAHAHEASDSQRDVRL